MMITPRKTPIRVFLVDGHNIFVSGLKLLIEHDARFVVIGTAANADEALKQSALQVADVIIFTLEFDDDHSLDFIPVLVSRSKAKLIGLTRNKDVAFQDKAVIKGARGIVKKEDSPKTLFSAIEKIHRGELWVDRNATSRILLGVAKEHAPQEPASVESKLGSLTKKEDQVLQSVVSSSEKPLKLIAPELKISENTLRNHLASIYHKLGVTSRLELYVFCNTQVRTN
ncbi:MAG: response regulator transcription factor [Sterolibacterium sp.]